jgi:archaellum component FlaG (FlaF/FlaG flagellin family)
VGGIREDYWGAYQAALITTAVTAGWIGGSFFVLSKSISNRDRGVAEKMIITGKIIASPAKLV